MACPPTTTVLRTRLVGRPTGGLSGGCSAVTAVDHSRSPVTVSDTCRAARTLSSPSARMLTGRGSGERFSTRQRTSRRPPTGRRGSSMVVETAKPSVSRASTPCAARSITTRSRRPSCAHS